MLPRALTIAGSDSGGGAGIQADLKTFAALGVYGTSAITSVTAQNTLGVAGVSDLDPEFVGLQVETVLSDIGADAVKTGMLSHSGIIKSVADQIRAFALDRLVVDPVMIAKSGHHLLVPEAREALVRDLMPLALVLTPNVHEAEVLTGRSIQNLQDMEKAARELVSLGPSHVVVKGGHLEGVATDILFDGQRLHYFRGERRMTRNTHGTGCTFAAAITAALARGSSVIDAVGEAKCYINTALAHALDLGQGHGPTHHLAGLYREAGRYRLLEALGQAVTILEGEPGLGRLLPEVQSNLVAVAPYAEGPQDIMGLTGRLVRCGDAVRALGFPLCGASRYLAALLWPVHQRWPHIAAAMNVRLDQEVLAACRRLNWRLQELAPDSGPSRWASLAAEASPQVLFDRGGWGKEPQARVLASDPGLVVEMVLALHREMEFR